MTMKFPHLGYFFLKVGMNMQHFSIFQFAHTMRCFFTSILSKYKHAVHNFQYCQLHNRCQFRKCDCARYFIFIWKKQKKRCKVGRHVDFRFSWLLTLGKAKLGTENIQLLNHFMANRSSCQGRPKWRRGMRMNIRGHCNRRCSSLWKIPCNSRPKAVIVF